MCYSEALVELMETVNNYRHEREFCEACYGLDETGLPEYPEGYAVISANGNREFDMELILTGKSQRAA